MDEAKVKRYSAILEIIILLTIAIYYINKIIVSNHIEEVSKNFNNSRQNPATIITAGVYGKSSSEVMSGIMGQKTQGVFKSFLKFLNPIFSIFAKMFSKMKSSVNDIRQILLPIRTFFFDTAQKFYNIIQKFTIGILYSTHKMRNSMRRSISGFNILMHSLEHSKNSIESMVTSPPVKMAVKWLDRAGWIKDKAGDLFCFDKDTYLKLDNGQYIKIENVKIGDILENGAEVITTHKFSNKYSVYKYDNIYVSGGHIVKENDSWVTVAESLKGTSVYVKPPLLYCLSTSTGEIKINDTIFKDFEGSTNKFINKTINTLILQKLNSLDTVHNNDDINESDYAVGLKYLENGFHPDTLVEMKGGYYKPIKDVTIGESLAFYNKVVGKVNINAKYIKYYLDHNNTIVTSNTKIFHNGMWKNIETLPNIKPDEHIGNVDAINLVTDNSTIRVKCGRSAKHYRDYVELVDDELETQIQNLVLKNACIN